MCAPTAQGQQWLRTSLSEFWVSTTMVQFHISSILSKLGVSTRTEGIIIARRERLVQLPTQPSGRDGLS